MTTTTTFRTAAYDPETLVLECWSPRCVTVQSTMPQGTAVVRFVEGTPGCTLDGDGTTIVRRDPDVTSTLVAGNAATLTELLEHAARHVREHHDGDTLDIAPLR